MATEAQQSFSIPLQPAGAEHHEPILIVGGGPIGMAAALGLAYFGIRSLLLDEDNKLSEGSRSICIQRNVLEVFDKLGCVEPMMAKGVSWKVGRTYFRTTELFQIRFPELGRNVFPPFINLQQFYTETYLLERIKESDLIEVRWLHQVTGVTQDEQGVTLEVSTPEGQISLHGPYALACDGSHSTLRHILKVNFPGHTHRDRFLIADIQARLSFPNERRFFFDPPSNPGRSVLIHPQPDNVWRIDWQVPETVDTNEARSPENMDRRIRAVIGAVPYELVWLSVYSFQQRLIERFSIGRVFFIGDSAHLMAPFGARGMNSGVQDADNLVWKLWLVMSGRAPGWLLDTYHSERWAAGHENQRVTNATMQFMVPHSQFKLFIRNLILRASLYLKPVRRFVNSGQLATPFTYRHSPIIARDEAPRISQFIRSPATLARWWHWRKGPQAGAVAPDGPGVLVGAHEKTRLRKLFGPGFIGLYFALDYSGGALFAAHALQQKLAIPATLYLILPPDVSVTEQQVPAGAIVLLDAEGILAEIYHARPGTFYLVRPDGHIAARRQQALPEDVYSLVNFACGRSGGVPVSSPQ